MAVVLPTGRTARWSVFAALAIAGLFYVKWHPYYDRAFVAASQHAIGRSILMGDQAQAPVPSWSAALGYALAYGKAIWQAMVLGLLLGSGVQALLPVDWVGRVLGGRGFGGALAGGLLAVPGMMCTCCAAPVVVGLRKHQASPGAAMAFWLGNTMLNPATLVFMGFVLGWHWAALRLLLGIPMVFGLGYLTAKMTTNTPAGAIDLPPAEPEPRAWGEALTELRRVERDGTLSSRGMALAAVCLYALGDASWRTYAYAAAYKSDDPMATRTAQALLAAPAIGRGDSGNHAQGHGFAGTRRAEQSGCAAVRGDGNVQREVFEPARDIDQQCAARCEGVVETHADEALR